MELKVTKHQIVEHMINTVKKMLHMNRVPNKAVLKILPEYRNALEEEMADVPEGNISIEVEADMVTRSQKVINRIMLKYKVPINFTLFKQHKPNKKESTLKRALITGITGQDGAYLAEFLLEKGYEVHGIKRRASLFNTERIDHLYQDPHEADRHFVLHYGDLTDSTNLIRIIQDVQPDEIYNLAA